MNLTSTGELVGMDGGTGKTTLVQIGAGLGIAANCIGWMIFFTMCAGFGAAVYFALLPLSLSAIGMVLTIVGAITRKHADIDTHVLASLFINLFGLVGGGVLTAIWQGWTVFAR